MLQMLSFATFVILCWAACVTGTWESWRLLIHSKIMPQESGLVCIICSSLFQIVHRKGFMTFLSLVIISVHFGGNLWYISIVCSFVISTDVVLQLICVFRVFWCNIYTRTTSRVLSVLIIMHLLWTLHVRSVITYLPSVSVASFDYWWGAGVKDGTVTHLVYLL